jgi:hypothetical protein
VDLGLQCVERLGQRGAESEEPAFQIGQWTCVERVDTTPAVVAPFALDDQTGGAQHAHVATDRRPADVEVGCDLAGGERPVAKPIEDLPAYGIGECRDDVDLQKRNTVVTELRG